MKLLCIERDNFSPPQLRVGEIYTLRSEWVCEKCATKWYVVEEVIIPTRGQGNRCPICHNITAPPPLNLHFLRRRFTPYRPDELGVTASEVAALYQPFKRTIKEKQS